VQKFLTHLAQLEKALIVPDEKPFPTKISPLHTQRTSIQQALAHAHYAPMQDDDPIVPLQEISHYLAWIAQGQELQRMLHTPQLRFWHQRNLLDVVSDSAVGQRRWFGRVGVEVVDIAPALRNLGERFE